MMYLGKDPVGLISGNKFEYEDFYDWGEDGFE